MQKQFSGKAWKFGDNIDTDLIIAARYLNTSDTAILASHLMEDARAGFVNEISQGDIIVGGENFGCGSSREHAPVAIKEAGISAVIAKSYARIFYRNAFNTGLPILEIQEADSIKEGDTLEIDLPNGVIKNLTQQCTYPFAPIPPFMLELLTSGGLIPYAKAQNLTK
ncbi:MAG: 3-isopropylmalate dehydratase small subunit [Helicobacter sp.]|uniref:3-isopropylmalate dehydratase small subunit n=1 Tax=Helicobacter sp. TaxID=218 RepID=UPI0023BD935C|nr:3-isopropylmalate dehydratase small subunit [Helicobacter sp.]MDE7175691.1 3-isopropylmalate dehydratase small subunit [Helicobacter sp.]